MKYVMRTQRKHTFAQYEASKTTQNIPTFSRRIEEETLLNGE
jgi:hypothetical protein